MAFFFSSSPPFIQPILEWKHRILPNKNSTQKTIDTTTTTPKRVCIGAFFSRTTRILYWRPSLMAFQTLEGFAAPLDVIMFKTCVSFRKKRGLWKIILEIMYFCGNKKKSAAFSTKHYYIFANFYFAHCPQNCTIDARSIHLWIKAPQSLQNTFLIPWRPTFPVTEHVNNEEIKVRLSLMSGVK